MDDREHFPDRVSSGANKKRGRSGRRLDPFWQTGAEDGVLCFQVPASRDAFQRRPDWCG